MMQTKLFEVRDRATCIPCIGTLMSHGGAYGHPDEWLLSRAGYSPDPPYLVLFSRLGPNPEEVQYDPYKWSGPTRTIPQAHRYISEHWDELQSGAVIDVEFILGESLSPKQTDCR